MATAELAECEGCTGAPCRKADKKYRKPDLTQIRQGYQIPLVSCEYERAARARETLKQSAIPAKYIGKTFEDYEITTATERACGLAWRLCKNPTARGLYLYGACGTGKTFLAAIIGQEYLKAGKQVIFGDVPTLLDEIKRTFDGQGSAQEIIDRYGTCDLLIFDDLGTGLVTEWSVGIMYQILNRRYNGGLATIITSNKI